MAPKRNFPGRASNPTPKKVYPFKVYSENDTFRYPRCNVSHL